MRPLLGGGVVGVVLLVLWVTQCSGPRPEVVGSPQLRAPESPGQPYVVDARVRNGGPGHGQVQVTARLRDTATGQAYQRDEQVQLEPGEDARVAIEVQAPLGEYQPDLEVTYPPG